MLKKSKEVRPDARVILISAFATASTAVEAMKEGAYDFVTKPVKKSLLLSAVDKAMERHSLRAENRRLRAMLEQGGVGSLIGRAPRFTRTMQLIRQVAPSEASVLILGESGTGKELAARAIHSLSERSSGHSWQ